MTRIIGLDAMAAQIPEGAMVAVPADYAGVPMALTRSMLRAGRGGLHLVCVPTGGMQVDLLVGAGLVATVETSAVTLGEAGGRRGSTVRRRRVALE